MPKLPKKMTKRSLRASATFDEYRRYSDAYDCTFRDWLDIRKTQWYDDLKNERVYRMWWEETA